MKVRKDKFDAALRGLLKAKPLPREKIKKSAKKPAKVIVPKPEQ